MKFFRMIFAFTALLVSGTATAADIDEMLTDAIGKLKSDIKTAKMDIEKVAVYAIEPDREGKVNINLVQDQVESALLETGRFKVINRKALKSLLEEQALSLTGVVDEAQMVKAGKLIGAQGFFYGSIEVQKNKLILTLKLIEVESSAVAYSRKFVGESRGFSRIGLYWGYVSTGVGLHYETSAGGVVIYPREGSQDLSNVGASGAMSVGLTYKQGFQALKYAMLGLDIGFASIFPRGSDGTAKATEAENFALGGGPANISIENIKIYSAKLKTYISCKEVFGWNHDWLNPYGGVSFSSYSIDVRMSGSAGGVDEYKELNLSHDMFIISPLVGIEVNATESLSLFGEGVFVLSEVTSDDGYLPYAVGNGGLVFAYSGHIPKGVTLNFGLKYYFNLF